jgi:kynureninase
MMRSDFYLEKAKELDGKDPLKQYRGQFVIDDPSVIYLDGNSLGRLPKTTMSILENTIKRQWGEDLIDSWNKDWIYKSAVIGDKIARLIGAEPGEVIISDNTSTNLYKLVSAALNYLPGRSTIVSDVFNFPSDLYILQGLIAESKNRVKLKLIGSADEITISDNEILKNLNKNTCLLTLSHVAFKSAFMYDLPKVTRMAHEAGALMLWDLSHSAGAVPIDLKSSGVDLAVGCTYKYMNGGPGAPAFLYVRKTLQKKLRPTIQGWFGEANPFTFSLNYTPDYGIRRFLTGTPPVLSLSSIEPGVDILLNAGMEQIRKKSLALSEFFIELWKDELETLGFRLASPLDYRQRGSHLSLKHDEAFRIVKALVDPSFLGKRVVPDFRTPDNIRLGFSPLYNTFKEIQGAVQKLKEIVRNRWFEKFDDTKGPVT